MKKAITVITLIAIACTLIVSGCTVSNKDTEETSLQNSYQLHYNFDSLKEIIDKSYLILDGHINGRYRDYEYRRIQFTEIEVKSIIYIKGQSPFTDDKVSYTPLGLYQGVYIIDDSEMISPSLKAAPRVYYMGVVNDVTKNYKNLNRIIDKIKERTSD